MSRITHRKGLSENLPQLAGAEFGWVLDERRLYIGNGVIADGAPVIGNTEILTEFSDILALTSTYTYKGESAGYISITGPNDESIVRSLQSKFDDFASVKDFGAVGDGVTDDTDAINRALYELFCRGLNAEIRRSLYFPAGIYKVSDTIKIPPHAKLYGEGLTSSIIKFISLEIVDVEDLVPGSRYAITTLGDTTWTDINAGLTSPAVNDIFIATSVGTGTGTARPVAEYVVETADSKQQTAANIGSGGAVGPTGIEMTSMAIYSNEDNTLLKLDSVTNSGFHYLGLHGPNIDPLLGLNGSAAIELASSVTPTHDITLSKLDTEGTTYGLSAAGAIKGVVLENSGLDFHYTGVYIHNPVVGAVSLVATEEYKIVAPSDTDFTLVGAPDNNVGTEFTATGPGAGSGTVISLSVPGPTGIVVSRNIFDNISNEGIHFHNVLFNSSAFNVFYDVGNAFTASAISPVIHMETNKCVSVGDLFEREDESIHPRIALLGNGGIALDSTHSIHLGSYERQVGVEALLGAGLSGTIFTNNNDLPNSYRIDYTLKDAAFADARMGSILVSSNNAGVTFSDDFSETSTLNVTLSAVEVGAPSDSNTEFQFVSTSGADTIINYSISRLD